jgi:hypothetical protein
LNFDFCISVFSSGKIPASSKYLSTGWLAILFFLP